MKTINLICPDQSDMLFQKMVFPDGQPHIKLDTDSIQATDKTAPLRILMRISSSDDLLLVLFLKNALDYLEFECVELHIAYLLAARMDRVMLAGEPFSLKVVASMLNTAAFKKVKVFDPHSEMTTALINRSYAINNHAFVQDALAAYHARHGMQPFSLVAPDAGALKKIHKLAQALDIQEVVECNKERDLKTGKLLSFKTTADNLSGQTCFIIDDICDGGGTFAGTAQLLKEKGAGKVVLIVSHGIFSRGTAIDFVDEIWCTDSYKAVDGVDCLPVMAYMQ